MANKYIGLIFDGRWKVIKPVSGGCYELQNIYNGNTIKVSHAQIEKVYNGKDTISHIICRRVDTNKSGVAITNNVKKRYAQNVAKRAGKK